jgi:hypothetical protein
LLILWSEVPHLLASCVVDAADGAERVEDEVGPFVALDLHRYELDVLDALMLEEVDDALVDYGCGKRVQGEIENLARGLHGKEDRALRLKPAALEELPGMHFQPLLIPRGPQVPPPPDAHVVRQPEVAIRWHLSRTITL